MYILKNAWTSIIRNKARNILIGVIIIVIASACAITLSIMNSANKIVQAYEEKYEVKATIEMNRDNLMKQMHPGEMNSESRINAFNNIKQVTVDEIKKYGDSEYVKNYYYTYSLGMNANDISEATDQIMKETTETTTNKPSNTPGIKPDSNNSNNESSSETTTETKITEEIKNMKAEEGAFDLVGYESYSSMKEFVSGEYTIIDGNVSSDFNSNSCVISKELAELNNLSVGSLITLVDPKDSNHTYTLKVTGIFTDNSEDSGDMAKMFTGSVNTIITNINVVQNIANGNSNLKATVTPTFILTGSDVADAFADEVKSKGLSDYFSVTNNLSEVESATEGVTNVSTFALTFLIITLIIGGVVLFVLNIINIRERKYEIGVLRTIGMSKVKVVWQFVLELLIVALIALTIGAGIGSLCSVNVSNALLKSEIQKSQSQMQSIGNNFGADFSQGGPGGQGGAQWGPGGHGGSQGGPGGQGGAQGGPGGPGSSKFSGTTQISQISDINAVVDITVLVQLLALGLGLTIIGSLSACVAIARFSPLEILRERS